MSQTNVKALFAAIELAKNENWWGWSTRERPVVVTGAPLEAILGICLKRQKNPLYPLLHDPVSGNSSLKRIQNGGKKR